jgi:4'-phosphopantetheinyl transferase
MSVDELQKADRFRFEIDRRRHIIGRGLLRRLLAKCLEMAPDKVRFDYGAFGKPALASDFAGAQLQFNVSHSGDVVLIAIAIGRAIGVDVEYIRTDIAAKENAVRFFSLRERMALATLAGRPQIDAFFSCWTRKEAYIKAHGAGLSLSLDQFDVSLLPGEAAHVLETRPDPAEARRWSLRELNAGHDHKAALAIEGRGWHLKIWDWPHCSCM